MHEEKQSIEKTTPSTLGPVEDADQSFRGDDLLENNSFSSSSLPPESQTHRESHQLSDYMERELKFLLTSKAAKKLDLNNTPYKKLTQHYFPAELVPAMGEVAVELAGIQGTLPKDFEFSRARIRRVKDIDGTSTFYLQAKGRLPDYDQSEKVEIASEISEDLYRKLKLVATAGTIKKTRHYLEGSIFLDDGAEVPVTAEIDFIRAAGPVGGERIQEKDRFYTVDLEVRNQEEIDRLRKGLSSFEFLKGKKALNLTDEPDDIRKPLSMSGLSASGFTSSVKSLLKDLKAL